jgi:hypothetical protein
MRKGWMLKGQSPLNMTENVGIGNFSKSFNKCVKNNKNLDILKTKSRQASQKITD